MPSGGIEPGEDPAAALRWEVADLAGADERLTPLAAADIVQGYLASGAPDPLAPEEVPID